MMIQETLFAAETQPAIIVSGRCLTPGTVDAPRLWGLSARQLHDAFWRSKGVQCVRRGVAISDEPLERGAELFLLVEPEQLVLFNLAQMIDRLTWLSASVTRLRLIDESQQPYSEQVVVDERGFVLRIERRYRPAIRGSSRVMLTSSRRVAAIWTTARTRHEGWDRVRRAVAWSKVDHFKCSGTTFIDGNLTHEGQLIDHLVSMWPHPEQAISGLEQIEPGVWHVEGEPAPCSALMIGPLWLGMGAVNLHHRCIVGPAWTRDVAAATESIDPVASETAIPLDGESLPIRFARIRKQRRAKAAMRPRSPATVQVKSILDIEVPANRTTPPPAVARGVYPAAKRAFDIAASAIGLIVLFPLLVAAAACIMIDDGWPVFFGHQRQGRGGRLFRCWKFRTMRHGAEKAALDLKRELSVARGTKPRMNADELDGQGNNNPSSSDPSPVPSLPLQNLCDGPQVLIKDDPRVTRVGQLLRKYNIDELPQLWNVLLGHMSLVGPRPSPDDENQYCPAWRDLRLSVRPGITGLWQLKRTREPGEDFQEWIKYDIEYVRTASFHFDLTILFRTFLMLLNRRTRSATHKTR